MPISPWVVVVFLSFSSFKVRNLHLHCIHARCRASTFWYWKVRRKLWKKNSHSIFSVWKKLRWNYYTLKHIFAAESRGVWFLFVWQFSVRIVVFADTTCTYISFLATRYVILLFSFRIKFFFSNCFAVCYGWWMFVCSNANTIYAIVTVRSSIWW